LRRSLLAAAEYDRGFLERKAFASAAVGADDLLDAAACSWSAARIARGEGRRFPAHPPLDATGIRMEIWC
jgi:predicted RNase H-like nuclease